MNNSTSTNSTITPSPLADPNISIISFTIAIPLKPESIATNELKNKTVNDLRKALLPKVKLLNPFGTLGTTMVKVKLVNRVRQQRSVSITKVANVQIHYLAPKGTPYDTSRDKRSSFLDSFIQSLQNKTKNRTASPS